MEQTLIILKPDCMEAGKAGEVIARFENAGFAIVAAKMARLGADILREHYAHVADKPFFPEIEAFMSSRPVVLLVLRAENAVSRARDLLGPTDSAEAPAGTIRGDLGTDKMKNIAHASDSVENAAVEIDRFFGAGELCAD
ncbi:MAG: nucleoside-diphosphate kinase [Puniceicoccaceae bacterium]